MLTIFDEYVKKNSTHEDLIDMKIAINNYGQNKTYDTNVSEIAQQPAQECDPLEKENK